MPERASQPWHVDFMLAALDMPCPRCHAGRLEPCRSPNPDAEALRWVHVRRYDRAVRKLWRTAERFTATLHFGIVDYPLNIERRGRNE